MEEIEKIEYGDKVMVTVHTDSYYIGFYLFQTLDGVFLTHRFEGGMGCVGILCDKKDVFFVEGKDLKIEELKFGVK